jgi:hypothetical protein
MEKINFGLALYGCGYTLADPSCEQADGICYFRAGNKPGPCTHSEGILSLIEIRSLIRAEGLESVPLGDGTTMMLQIHGMTSGLALTTRNPSWRNFTMRMRTALAALWLGALT